MVMYIMIQNSMILHIQDSRNSYNSAACGCSVILYWACLCCAVLCCAVLCCAVLCCAVLCCAMLCCAVLCCAVLCCIVQYCTVLYCTVLYCTVLYCTVLHCAIMYCTAVYCFVIQCTATLNNCFLRILTILLQQFQIRGESYGQQSWSGILFFGLRGALGCGGLCHCTTHSSTSASQQLLWHWRG